MLGDLLRHVLGPVLNCNMTPRLTPHAGALKGRYFILKRAGKLENLSSISRPPGR